VFVFDYRPLTKILHCQVHIVADMNKQHFHIFLAMFLLSSSDTIMNLTEVGLADQLYFPAGAKCLSLLVTSSTLIKQTNSSIKVATRNCVLRGIILHSLL